jgi:hypothetical protein
LAAQGLEGAAQPFRQTFEHGDYSLRNYRGTIITLVLKNTSPLLLPPGAGLWI